MNILTFNSNKVLAPVVLFIVIVMTRYPRSNTEKPTAVPNPAVNTAGHMRIVNSKDLQAITLHSVALQHVLQVIQLGKLWGCSAICRTAHISQ